MTIVRGPVPCTTMDGLTIENGNERTKKCINTNQCKSRDVSCCVRRKRVSSLAVVEMVFREKCVDMLEFFLCGFVPLQLPFAR